MGRISRLKLIGSSARLAVRAVKQTKQTSDGDQVFIGITSDNHWKRFCDHFERPDLLSDPTLKTNEDRVKARERIRPIVAEAFGRHTTAEVLEICERIELPFAPVAQTKDLFDDPQLNANGRMLQTRLPDGSMTKLPRLPIEMNDHDIGLRLQPPEVGEHTRDILAELGLDDAAIAELEGKGVIVAEAKAAAE